jgi:energy-coupling factor transporter ATP-binding protein EcfA2
MVFQKPRQPHCGDVEEDDVAFAPDKPGLPAEEIRRGGRGAALRRYL